MANQVKIPFGALTSGSSIALLAVNTNTRAYAPDGKVIEGVIGDPRLEIAVLDTLDRFTVTVKSLNAAIAGVTEEQITASLKSRQYIGVELVNAMASPFLARFGFGVSYSVKADATKIATAPTPALGGFGKPAKTAAE
jgi:hypothetical protein